MLDAMTCCSILNLYPNYCIICNCTERLLSVSAEKLHVLIESVLLHFAINDYITVTCGLLSFIYWGRYELNENCSSYLTTYQLAIFLEFV